LLKFNLEFIDLQ